MANYSEEIAYWYLRWNGFFPIRNLVIHRSALTKYGSDTVLLALRLPFVSEPIGGQPDDWDKSFFSSFDSHISIGLICEVKSGKYQTSSLFIRENISYVIGRFGFTPNHHELVDPVCKQAITTVTDKFHIAKILFSYTANGRENKEFIHVNLTHCEDFIIDRIKKYPRDKYADRILFPSETIQGMIERFRNDAKNAQRLTGSNTTLE